MSKKFIDFADEQGTLFESIFVNLSLDKTLAQSGL